MDFKLFTFYILECKECFDFVDVHAKPLFEWHYFKKISTEGIKTKDTFFNYSEDRSHSFTKKLIRIWEEEVKFFKILLVIINKIVLCGKQVPLYSN